METMAYRAQMIASKDGMNMMHMMSMNSVVYPITVTRRVGWFSTESIVYDCDSNMLASIIRFHFFVYDSLRFRFCESLMSSFFQLYQLLYLLRTVCMVIFIVLGISYTYDSIFIRFGF